MRRQILLFGTVVALVAMALPGSALAAKPGAGTCTTGNIGTGTWTSFTVTGNCTIDAGANVQINGDLTVADGAILNDHAAAGYQGAQVHISGNVKVGKGAVLGLGTYLTPGSVGLDTVGGDIVANQPLTLYLGSITVGGNVISNGGGLLSTSAEDFRNFPVKDNVIHGNLIIQGWQGGWIGLIRNHVDGNVIFTRNASLSHPPSFPGEPPDAGGPGTDPDSSEVQTNSISGNLICHGNTPPAQVNSLDGGLPNDVGGNAIGECAGLTQ
jgi:hypothetical protein